MEPLEPVWRGGTCGTEDLISLYNVIYTIQLMGTPHLKAAAMLYLLVSSTATFMLTALLMLLTTCLTFSYGFAAQKPTSAMQELTSFLSHSYLSLVNSGTPYLFLHFYFLMT